MYKDLSLKEKAKVIREGVRLGLNSIDDILSLYDEAISYLQGGPIVSPYGQWKYPGKDTIIPSNNITMDNVNYPVLGISDTGDAKVMMPWNDYKFRGSMVYEHPLIGNLALEGKKFNRQKDLDIPFIIQKVNKSNADFVQRLKDLNRAYIQDWENPNMIATHKLSWADDGIVYPLVQNINGRLIDFSRPPYNIWAGYDSAIKNNDTIHMTPEEAEWFTTHYKNYYPVFDKYSKGGTLYQDGGDAGIYYGNYNNKRFNTQQGINDLREWISAKIMSSLSTNNSNEKETSFPPAFTQNGGTAQASYLLSRKPQRDMFLRHGYIQGKNKDYGLVRNAVGNKNIPVYQTAEDANVEEENLINIGWKYNNDGSIPEDTKLFHAGYYPTATYIDGKTGLIYLKSWDLNDYYNPKYYKGIKRIGSKILDLIGSPVVITTGYLDTGFNALDNNWKSTLITPQLNSYLDSIGIIKDEYGIHLPEVVITPNEYKKGGSIHIDPKNKGKLTETMRRTGKSKYELAHSKNPLTRKRALFAINASHWKHLNGGHLFLEDGQIFKRPLDDLTGRNILTSPILPPKSYYEQFTIPELEPKKPQPLQPLEGTYGSKYSELIPMSDGTYVNNPINKGLQQDWRTYALEFAPFLAIGAGPAIGSTATWLASKPALYNLGRMTLGSEIGGRGVDLASNLFTGNTWGLNVGNVVEGITGWNPYSTLVGLFVTDAMNPGYYISPLHIINWMSNITKGVNNVLSKDYVIPFGFRSVANDGQVTNQLKNFRSNYLTRSTINKVLRNNPNLNSEYRENLVEAAKNMVYTKPVDGSYRMYMTFNGETPRMTPDGIFQYNMEIPRYDRWSNLHEIGHFVDDATGLPSSNLQRIPGYRYSAFDESTGTPMEQFADMFANKYSRRRLPYDIQTHEVGLPWSLLNRINTTKDYNLADDFLNITNLKTGEVYKSGRPRASISTRQYRQDNIMGLVPLQSMVEWTPEQWTAAQDAAIARGDMAEAQRLRDLHFRISAPNTEITDIQYHGSPYTFNVFDPAKRGNTDQGWFGKGYYFTPSQEYAAMYGDTRPFYINAENVYTKGVGTAYFGRESSPQTKVWLKMQNKRGKGAEAETILDDLRFSDAVRDAMPQTKPYNGIFEEVVTRNNNQMKLADAVTFDDLDRRIPLGERDNFNLKDIRYGLIPLGGIGLYGLQNRVNKHYE